MKISFTIADSAPPEEKLYRLYFHYIWPFYVKNRCDLIQTAKESGLRLYIVKQQFRYNPFIVKKLLKEASHIYKIRNKKSKLELMIESMIIRSKNPKQSLAYRYGTDKVKKEIDVIVERNVK